MTKHSVQLLFCLALVLTTWPATGAAPGEQTRTVKRVPIEPTSPASGRDMYMHYCAVCHGRQGRGGGPAAAALKIQPADLTTLAQQNHSEFPRRRVESTLRFGSALPSHGSSEMPVWGPLFQSLNRFNNAEVEQRINNLTGYLESIQGH
jgi:mono/diheme cytochrome c family protein